MVKISTDENLHKAAKDGDHDEQFIKEAGRDAETIQGRPENQIKTETKSMTDSTQAPITTIAEVGKHDGQSVTIRGWLYNKRESGKLIFPYFS